MIHCYRIGNPIKTDSVIADIRKDEGIPEGWEINVPEKKLEYSMSDSACVYGLGETVRGMNKRGWLYTSDNTDDPVHVESRHSLYASHNFILYDSPETRFGLYVDTPGKIDFDIGYTDYRKLIIRFEDLDADIYQITEKSSFDIIRAFRSIIGKSYIPPKWALGFGQSRWSYMNEEEVRDVVRNYRENQIPLDMVYLDIDYMEDYKDFTVNESRFPDFTGFVKEMKEQGIHLVPIIDAGVKIEEGYDVYEEGKRQGYFCKKENGEELVAAVWPGKVHCPDFLNESARKWFGSFYGRLLEKGIDGFWNDMNEPSIFYTEDHLEEVFEALEQYKGKNLNIRSFFSFQELVRTLSNNPDDYRRFFHSYHGKKIRHDKVHNLYGYYMTRAAGEAFEQLSPDKRILMFSRASYIGMHRYGGVWTGDNASWWSHLLLNIQQMPGLNMCGFLFSGADIGGFGQDCTEDLLMRWAEFGIFTPLFRNHSAEGTRRQEFFRFERKKDFANIVSIRYALLPYIYSELMKAILHDGMYMAPLAFAYPDDRRAAETEDQLLVGQSIMIAPVYRQNAEGRYVYLPERMKLLRMRSPKDYDEEVLEKGDHYIESGLNEVLIFIRPGQVLPVAKPAQTVEEIDYRSLKYITYEADPETYEMYNDDGITRINM